MSKLMAAVALAITVPGVAHAQAGPAENPKMECCEKMKDKCTCCDRMAGKPAKGSPASSSDPHANHDVAPGAERVDGHAHR